MRKSKILLVVLTLFLLIPASITWAQDFTVSRFINGLVVHSYNTLQGSVKVYLPDDIRPGDIISGTVMAVPSGKNEKEMRKNLAELMKYSLSLNGNKIIPGDKPVNFEWLVHSDRQQINPIELIHVSAVKPRNLSPEIKSFQPASVPGILDFRLDKRIYFTDNSILLLSPFGSINKNLKYTLQDAKGKKLELKPNAQSPRQSVFEIPKDIALGNTIITIYQTGKGGSDAVPAEQVSFKFSLVEFEFNAQKPELKKGQSTQLWWRLKGLDTVSDKLPAVVIENINPVNINMPAGNFQSIAITPANANARNGQTITALVNGPFNINASVYINQDDYCDAFNGQMRVIKTKKDYDAWTTALKKDLQSYINKQGADKVGQAARRNAQAVIDNIPNCSDDSKVKDCLSLITYYLRNITVPMAAATFWLSGFEAYKAAIKAITAGLGGKPELIDWDVIMNGLKFIEIMGKEADDETLQTKSKEAQKLIETIKNLKEKNEKIKELKGKLDELNQNANDKKIGINDLPDRHYNTEWLSNISWKVAFGEPVNYYDIPGTGSENKTDTIPCKTLEDELKKLWDELQALKDELAGIDAAIGQAKKDTSGCGKAVADKKAAAAKANEEFNSQKNRKKNWEQGGKEAPQNVKDAFNDAEEKKKAADDALKAQKKKCDDLTQKLQQLESRKAFLPYKIKQLEDLINIFKTELEKCKQKAAEEKKKKDDDDKRKADEESAAASAAEQLEEQRRKSVETNSYLLLNIYELGLIQSDEFWEMKGVWDWLPKLLSAVNLEGTNVDAALKAILDQAEDKAGVPGSTDIIQALGGVYQIVAALKDPCTALGKSKTVQRLKSRTNKLTGSLYTDLEALDKADKLCELIEKLEKIAKAAGGK